MKPLRTGARKWSVEQLTADDERFAASTKWSSVKRCNKRGKPASGIRCEVNGWSERPRPKTVIHCPIVRVWFWRKYAGAGKEYHSTLHQQVKRTGEQKIGQRPDNCWMLTKPRERIELEEHTYINITFRPHSVSPSTILRHAEAQQKLSYSGPSTDAQKQSDRTPPYSLSTNALIRDTRYTIEERQRTCRHGSSTKRKQRKLKSLIWVNVSSVENRR